MRTIRRILIAIKDYTAKTTPALAKGAQLARALDARVELFHGISTPLYVDGYAVTGVELPRIEHDLRSRVLTHLERMAAKLRQEGTKVTVAVEWDYPGYEAIVRRAQQMHTDLIVADQHPGRHRVAGLLHLTDWELLRLSPVPVPSRARPGTRVFEARKTGPTYSDGKLNTGARAPRDSTRLACLRAVSLHGRPGHDDQP